MKKLITLATIFFVATAVFAQGNIPIGLQQIMEQNPDHYIEFNNWQNKIPIEIRDGLLPAKNGNETVWVQDSTMYHVADNNELTLEWREKILNRNEHGNKTNRISHFWDVPSHSWTNRDTTAITYNDPDTMSNYLKKPWNNTTNEWADTSKFFKFDEDYNIQLYISKGWDYEENTFFYGMKLFMAYDENNNRIEEHALELELSTEMWVNSYLASYTYDNGLMQEELWRFWDVYEEEWYSSMKYIYSYDENGNLTQSLFYHYNNQTEEWKNTGKRLMFYDENGNKVEEISQTLDIETEEWVNSSQHLLSYDENNNNVVYLGKTWDNETEEWINSHKAMNTYNELGQYTEQQFQNWDLEAGEWLNTSQYLYFYDENENMSYQTKQTWDTIINDWVYNWRYDYFYSEFEFNNINEAHGNLISIYPNPATEKIRVSGDVLLKKANISIYSISGKKMKSVFLNNQNEIDIKNLPEGVYLVEIQTKKGDIVKRLVKK